MALECAPDVSGGLQRQRTEQSKFDIGGLGQFPDFHRAVGFGENLKNFHVAGDFQGAQLEWLDRVRAGERGHAQGMRTR